MITIHKYPLKLTNDQIIDLPVLHEVLTAGYDGNNNLCIWVQVEAYDYVVPIHFHVIGTGNAMPDHKVDYINTVRDRFTSPDTVFIWHVFKEAKI